MIKHYTIFSIIAILILSITIIILEKENNKLEQTVQKQKDMNIAVNDTLKSFKAKDSLNHYQIQIIKSENIKTFLQLQTSNMEVKKLQDIVNQQDKRLHSLSSVTYIQENTKFDTTYIRSRYIGNNIINDSINNNWIKFNYYAKNDTVNFKLKVRNEYYVTLGEEKIKQGLFKKSIIKPIVEVYNLNPYSEVKGLRAFEVDDKRKSTNKRFGIGPQLGCGINQNQSICYIGIGFNYNLIQF